MFLFKIGKNDLDEADKICDKWLTSLLKRPMAEEYKYCLESHVSQWRRLKLEITKVDKILAGLFVSGDRLVSSRWSCRNKSRVWAEPNCSLRPHTVVKDIFGVRVIRSIYFRQEP